MAILIAESGSTKTDWRLIENNGVISQFKSLGFNPYYQEEDSITHEILTEIAPNIATEIKEIFYYGTGVTNLEKKQIILNALKKVFPNSKIDVNDDMLAAARSLCINEPGIACILGTGANSCQYDGEKFIDQVPSLGFWLGDEGSGGHLGKELIKRYIRKELPEEIYAKFTQKYGELGRLEILDKAYKQPFPNRYFAGYSKFLFNNRNHPYIYLLLYDSFISFFQTSVMKYADYQQYKVHFTGSIAFYYSDILRKAATDCKITIGVIMESPIAGLTLFHNKNLK